MDLNLFDLNIIAKFPYFIYLVGLLALYGIILCLFKLIFGR